MLMLCHDTQLTVARNTSISVCQYTDDTVTPSWTSFLNMEVLMQASSLYCHLTVSKHQDAG